MSMYGVSSDPSDTVSATPMAEDEAGDYPQPTNVRLEPKGRDQIEVKWDYDERVEGAGTSMHFVIGYTEAAGTSFGGSVGPQAVQSTDGRDARSHLIENLKVNQSYLIAVRAEHSGRAADLEADWRYRSSPREMTPAPVHQPQNVTVMAGDGQLMVTWDEVASVGDCRRSPSGSRDCGYRVEWRAANQSYDNHGPTDGPEGC